ncbi:MAG: hypothetical protein ACQEWW_03880 [Bacillota bacterium]
MKSRKQIVFTAPLLIVSIFSFFPPSSTDPIEGVDVHVNSEITYQTHVGFGTFLAWWGNSIGGWPEVGVWDLYTNGSCLHKKRNTHSHNVVTRTGIGNYEHIEL